MRRSVIILALAAFLVAAVSVPVTAAEGSNTPLPAAEQDFFSKINAERASEGLAALKWHAQAASVARAHSNDMASDAELRHNPNLGSQMSNWEALGENVGQGPSVDSIHAAFMASAPHRANVLGSFTHVGVGVVERDGSLWVTEVFVTPSSSSGSGGSGSGGTGGGSGGGSTGSVGGGGASPLPRASGRAMPTASSSAPTARVRAALIGVHRISRAAAPDLHVGMGTLSALERLLDDEVLPSPPATCRPAAPC